MGARRVWLAGWEWDCCGDPFTVGDDVTLWVDDRVGEWEMTYLGPELAASVDGVESHHEDGGAIALRGTVTAISGVTVGFVDRRQKRELPLQAAPKPFAVGGGVAMTPMPRPYVTVRELVPDSAQLHDVPRVPWPPRENEGLEDPAEPVPEGREGYIVDLDVSGSA